MGLRASNVTTMTVVDDTYSGHVEPQTAARRTLPGATIIKMSVGPMDNNTYLVTCSRSGETLMIDAANDPELLVDLVRENAPKLALIVTSHQLPFLRVYGYDKAAGRTAHRARGSLNPMVCRPTDTADRQWPRGPVT